MRRLFVDKGRHATLKERSACQEHVIDLCRLAGHPTPAEKDPTGESFTFEAGNQRPTWLDLAHRALDEAARPGRRGDPGAAAGPESEVGGKKRK